MLLRGGERVPLVPKSVDLLALLVQRAGEVVTREALMDALWPEVAVEEGNLTKLVFHLRKALGEASIETVPRRGYRFAGEVRAESAPEAIAVLPFADLSEGHTEATLCEGVSEEILNALSRVPGLKVVSRTSSFQFGDGKVGAREIGEKLSATLIVEGSLRRAGGSVRIAARLVDAQTGYQRWADTLEAPATSVLGLQLAVAKAVARQVRGGKPAALPAAPPVSLAAYELCIQGRYLWNRRPGEVVWQAIRCFERALELEPRYAAAWAGLADVYATLGSWENSVLEPDDAQARATRFAARALELDPELAEAHTTLAYTALHHACDFAGAAERFRHAISLNPSYAPAHHWFAHCLVAERRFDEALAESRLALASDPMNLLMTVHLAWHHQLARKPALALEEAGRVIKMDAHYQWGHYFAGWALEALGEPGRAVVAMREAVRCGGENAVMVAGLCRAHAAAGDRAQALAVLARLEELRNGRALLAYEEALVHLALGDRRSALDLLQRAARDRSGWMAYLDVDARLDPLRGDPEFERLRMARPAG